MATNTTDAIRKPPLGIGVLDALAGPHGIDRYLEIVRPLWSLRDARARVTQVERPTPDSVTLTLRPNRGWTGFSAGQFVRVGVEINGVRETRCYSPACAEGSSDTLELTVRRHAEGKVSGFLLSQAQPGMVVELSEAAGDFVLPRARPAQLVLLSGGSGITPVMSMLRTLCAEGHAGEVVFIHFCGTAASAVYAAELERLAARHTNITVAHGFTRGGAGELHGHLERSQLEQLGVDSASWPAYVCGPPALIEAARGLWPEGLLNVESFLPPSPSVPAGEAEGSLTFAGSELSVANDGRTLLEQAEAAGLSPEFGCRMGICKSCTCRKTAGAIRNALTGTITSGEDEDIQICISVPVGDVALEL